ncbi:MAG: DNA polymerase III subunit beta [Bacteroidaceae bacterium]|nr:DNA polymerase III subunit beta [Bacteroidaceae bacterium]
MRVTISSSAFSSHLQMAGKVLAKKNPMPILECFLIEVKDSMMTITASNSENSIITSVQLIEHEGDGCLCINAETLISTIKEIPEQPLILEYNEKTSELRGKHSCGEFSVVCQEAAGFPPPVPVNGGLKITISSKELVSGVSNCIIATADDNVMLFKKGIYFDIHEDSVIIVATDGRKLVKKTLRDVKPGIVGNFILPMSIAGILKSVVKNECNAEIAFDQQRATIIIGDTTIYFRLVETRYPNYNAVIPNRSSIVVSLDRVSLIGALKRVGVFCNKSSNFIKFELKNNQAIITGSDSNNATSAEEFLPCDYEGAPFSIGFGYTFFVEILNGIEVESVTLELLAPERPCVIKGVDDDLLMLLMPMKIDE